MNSSKVVVFQSTKVWNNHSVYYKNRLKNKFELHMQLEYKRARQLLYGPEFNLKVVYIHAYDI